MKIFISYAFTGEDVSAVESRLAAVRDMLLAGNHEVYCFHFDVERTDDMSEAECIRCALKKMVDYDTLIVIATSERRSEGMLIEVGAALARGKQVIYAQHESAIGKTYLPDLASRSFVWSTDDQLMTELKRV